MEAMHRRVIPVLLALILGLGPELAGRGSTAVAQTTGPEKTVLAAASGTAGTSSGASEPVAFSGQAAITGRVINDPDFNAPPILELRIDLRGITGHGLNLGKTYQVASQAILHRPLLAFDSIELGFSFVADGNVVRAGSAKASFDIYYSAAQGMTTTPVRIATPTSSL